MQILMNNAMKEITIADLDNYVALPISVPTKALEAMKSRKSVWYTSVAYVMNQNAGHSNFDKKLSFISTNENSAGAFPESFAPSKIMGIIPAAIEENVHSYTGGAPALFPMQLLKRDKVYVFVCRGEELDPTEDKLFYYAAAHFFVPD